MTLRKQMGENVDKNGFHTLQSTMLHLTFNPLLKFNNRKIAAAYSQPLVSVDYSQSHSDNFGNFVWRPALALASTFRFDGYLVALVRSEVVILLFFTV
jgi:hypothetical protein